MLNATTPPRDPDADLRKPAAESRKPKTEQPSTTAARIKSFVRKNLLASPEFPRLYADVVISSAPNSPEAKILARNYKKIVEHVNARINNARIHNERINTNMAACKSCTHIKVTGVRCGSPAPRGEQFCYFHQRMMRGVSTPPNARLHPIALIENEEAIQASLMEVTNALARNTIDLKRAELILRALEPAVEVNAKPMTYLQTRATLTVNAAEANATHRKPPSRAGLPAESLKSRKEPASG